MNRNLVGLLLTTTLMIAGCGSSTGGTLEITENGTYDVSGYDQVVVQVDDRAVIVQEPGPEPETEPTTQESVAEAPDAQTAPQDLNLTRVQFSEFSMELPSAMVEDYTEAELTESNMFSFEIQGDDSSYSCYLSIAILQGNNLTLDQLSDGPQQDVNGTLMAVKHGHSADSRTVEVYFCTDDSYVSLFFSHPVSADATYAEYADSFYQTIELS